MREKYEELACDIVVFETADVIITSDPVGVDQGQMGGNSNSQ